MSPAKTLRSSRWVGWELPSSDLRIFKGGGAGKVTSSNLKSSRWEGWTVTSSNLEGFKVDGMGADQWRVHGIQG